MSDLIDIYILQSQPIIIDNILHNDIIYIDSENINSNLSNKLKCIRIKNIKVNFLCAKPSGMSLKQFEELTEEIREKNETDDNRIEIKHVQKYDSQLFTFENKLDYIQFESNNPWVLKRTYENLRTELIRYYHTMDTKQLQSFDKEFYNQTESPFRNVQFGIDLNQIQYYLSCHHNIPCVGNIKINTKNIQITSKSPTDLLQIEKFYEVDFKNIHETFIKSNSLDSTLYKSIKTISYDIETYNKKKITLDPKDSTQPIIAIGFAIFQLGDIKPLKRFCIISKDFSKDEIEKYKYTVENKTLAGINCKIYDIKDYDEADDMTKYIIVPDEKGILNIFANYIKVVKPYFISGFNNWTFDDKWVHAKTEQYKIDMNLNSALNIYEQSTKMSPLNTKYQILAVKLDNEMVRRADGYATWKNCFTIMHDTMFAALKEDPKRFSNRTRKNLDTMLEVYNINNPYNNSQLSKTGLSIIKMFDYWERSEHIYEIAKYCCQDAWITGTFAIKRNMYGDLIEMSNMTNTTTQDSVFRAVNIRVSNTIAKYAYDEGYALFDIPERDTRNRRIQSLMGNKYYDRRTLVGGMVKNKRNGREKFIVALDYSSMYPSQKEGSNVDTSSRVSSDIIEHPENYNLEIIDKYFLEDMYGPRWFYKFVNKSNGKEYNIEQFFVEYKLDKKTILELKETYKKIITKIANNIQEPFLESYRDLILERFKNEINPIHRSSNLSLEQLILDNNPLPNTVKYPLYFCQSPKDEITDLPIIHYSIKEKLLSDFRARRVEVKADMKKTNDPTVKIQLSAKEKAIKVVMNSEYGQTGSELFSHYDSDIGGAVTYGSRSCIMELTSCLFSTHFYVTEDYMKNKYLMELINPTKYRSESIAKIEKIIYKPNWKLALEGTNRTLSELIEILQIHTICPNKFNNVSTKKELYDIIDNMTKEELETFVDYDYQDKKYNRKYKRDGLKFKIFYQNYFNRIDFELPPRRITSRDLYYKLREQYLENPNEEIELYCITLPESQLIYQDTDSNYYTNNSIVYMYPYLNPTTVNEIMKDLISHNNLLSCLIPDIIHRRPISVGFEGAFIVARYLNKKKKYYGKKWSSSMKDYVEIERDSKYKFNEYELNYIQETLKLDSKNIKDKIKIKYDWQNLPDDYESFLDAPSGDVMGNYNSYYSTIPYKDGSFFNANQELIGDKDFIDYVNQCGIKCTGVDLARRDQYKFINYNHVLVIKNDMKYVDIVDDFSIDKINIENKIEEEKFKLTPIINKLIDDFKNKSIVNHDFPLNYYAKFKVYKDNLSEVKPIVNKFITFLENRAKISGEDVRKDSMYKHMPEFGQRVSYVILNPNLQEVRDSGLISEGNAVKDKACLINVALEYFGRNTKKMEQYTDLDYKNIDVLDLLDYQDYFEHLITSLCNYMVVEKDPTIVRYLDEDWILQQNKNEKELEEDMGKEIMKIKNRLKNEIMKYYYPKGKKIITGSNKYVKETKEKNRTFKYDNKFNMKLFDLEEEFIKPTRIIKNRNFDIYNHLQQISLENIDKNILTLNRLQEDFSIKGEIEKYNKISELLNLYDQLYNIIYQSSDTDLELNVKMKIENYSNGKIKFNVSYRRSNETKWQGTPNTQFNEHNNILGNNNKISVKKFYNFNLFANFIYNHIPNCVISSDNKSITIHEKYYDCFINLLNFIFNN